MRGSWATAMLLVVACTLNQPHDAQTGRATSGTTAVQPAASTGACTQVRMRELVERFFLFYNRHDVDGLTSTFQTDHRFFEYFDSIDGQAGSITDRPRWEQYLHARFAAGDLLLNPRITFVSADDRQNEAVVSVQFTRVLHGQHVAAHVKVVCHDGRLTRSVMNTG